MRRATPSPRMRLLAAAMLITLSLAGCAQTAPEPEWHDPQTGMHGKPNHAAIAALIGEPVVMDHDHNDALQHRGSHNIRQVGYSGLDVTIGDNGFANFVIHDDADETLAFVAIDGDATGGFAIVDIADPGNMSVLGKYWIDGNSIQEVRVTPDGDFAVMNVQSLPGLGTPAGLLDGDGLRDCTVCIHVVDVRDRSNPVFVSAMPVELLGTHNFDFATIAGQLYLFYVGQPLYNPYPDPGNHVYIARLERTPTGAVLVPVRDFAYNPVDDVPGQRPDRIFPHDVLVQQHPDGRLLAYVSSWDAGMAIFDVSNPLMPTFLAVEQTRTPSDALAIHWIMQEATARADGKVYAWSAPEIGSLGTGSGVIRAYDVTDPTKPAQVGTWSLPGNVSIEGAYRMSPHTAVPDMATGLLAVSHYHAGMWLLDITDPTAPQHVAYHFPVGPEDAPISGPYWWKKPNFNPDGYGPNVYMTRFHDGLLWMTDRGTGLYALEYTGPVPGPLA